MAIYKPRGGLRGIQPAGTLILDFWPPELEENKFLSHPVCGILLCPREKSLEKSPRSKDHGKDFAFNSTSIQTLH